MNERAKKWQSDSMSEVKWNRITVPKIVSHAFLWQRKRLNTSRREMGKGRRKRTEAGAVNSDQLSGGRFGAGSRSQQFLLYAHCFFVFRNSLCAFVGLRGLRVYVLSQLNFILVNDDWINDTGTLFFLFFLFFTTIYILYIYIFF